MRLEPLVPSLVASGRLRVDVETGLIYKDVAGRLLDGVEHNAMPELA